MADFECNVIVVGAGVVGLAAARALARAGHETIVVEAAGAIGTGTSSRNSEVIHAGLYYPAGGLKATACVAGKHRLYAYCAENDVPHARIGKLLVLAPGDDPRRLDAIVAGARANGVYDLERLDAKGVARLEPALDTGGGLLSPSTGIVDSHALMLAFRRDAEAAGAAIALETPVLGGDVRHGLVIRTGGREGAEISARAIVNCAGLAAPDLLRDFAGFPAERIPRAFYAKGNYFGFSGKTPFQRLVYPLPEAAGLGVHATLDLARRLRFGPDVEWVEDPTALAVDPARARRFEAAIRAYWPDLPAGSLYPDYAGIRPKLGGPGAPASDFVLQDESEHGIPGLLNLFGIESPGLTASLALADHIVARIDARRR